MLHQARVAAVIQKNTLGRWLAEAILEKTRGRKRKARGLLKVSSEVKSMKNGHCLYVQRGRDTQANLKWRVGTTTRPDKRPRESYRENRDCLGELERVNLVCGLDKETAKALEPVLMDLLGEIAPAGKCNLRRR